VLFFLPLLRISLMLEELIFFHQRNVLHNMTMTFDENVCSLLVYPYAQKFLLYRHRREKAVNRESCHARVYGFKLKE
jgi:hypothetical protein